MNSVKYVFLFLICFLAQHLQGQEVYEADLKKYSDSLRFSKTESVRIEYNDSFKDLLNTLFQDDEPFKIRLDSASSKVSVLNSDDGKMRIVSWVLINDKEEYFNHCVVLYRKKAGSTERVFWLKDNMEAGSDSLYEDYNQDFWPGALYYQVHQFKKNRKQYYCVLGLDGKNSFSNRKVIDVLWVDKSGELHIGAPVFYSSKTDYTPQYRVFFEYADQSTMLLRFEKEEKMITFSNLVPSQPDKTGRRQYYIPDGRIDFYRLSKKGKWIKFEGLEQFDLPGNS